MWTMYNIIEGIRNYYFLGFKTLVVKLKEIKSEFIQVIIVFGLYFS